VKELGFSILTEFPIGRFEKTSHSQQGYWNVRCKILHLNDKAGITYA
jgi:hypothetical protein